MRNDLSLPIHVILCLLVGGGALLAGCGLRPPATPPPFRLYQGPTVTLPTPLPPEDPTATATLVMMAPWTATPAPTNTPLPAEGLALVTDVLDGETVLVVLQGDQVNAPYSVRLLGVDAPPQNGIDPWGTVTVETLRRWLSGKVVRLVQDTTVQDAEGMLPRYLFLEDELINRRLLELGLAQPSFQPPDTARRTEFQAAADSARTAERGLWGPPPTPTALPTTSTPLIPTLTLTPTGTAPLRATPTVTPTTPILPLIPPATITPTTTITP